MALPNTNQPIAPSPPAALPAGTPADIAAFYDYWLSLPRAGLVPRLADYLDHAPARLQPFVAITDVHSINDMRLRLMGTGLVSMFGRDETGKGVVMTYAKGIRAFMCKVVWHSVSRPVGYICLRTIRTASGLVVHIPSICLQMFNREGAAPMTIAYTRSQPESLGLDTDDQFHMALDLKITAWIDLGAGVPEKGQLEFAG